jgi:hypothetical protein
VLPAPTTTPNFVDGVVVGAVVKVIPGGQLIISTARDMQRMLVTSQ